MNGVRAAQHDLDRRGLGVLGLGHLCVDLCQGAVPALLPFLASRRGYSYAELGALVLAATIASSVIQPLFGLLSDRSARAWLMPSGVLLGGVGVALVGVLPEFEATAAAIALSGVGVAAFHPEGARFANLVSGSRRGRGMSLFSVGGNAGLALGPVLTTPLVLAFGLPGTLGLVVLPLLAAAVILWDLPRLQAPGGTAHTAATVAATGTDAWGPFSRLGAVISLRTGIYFGLQTFVPAYFVTQFATSEAAGNVALTAMLVAGAVGTLVGGVLTDRLGARAVLVGSLAVALPLLVAFPLTGRTPATVLLAGVGFVTIASFSVTVVLGQEYLPNRLGLAAGVTLGLSIGLGGVAAAVLGLVADAYDLETVMWIIAALPVPALALALTLPRVRREARALTAPPRAEVAAR